MRIELDTGYINWEIAEYSHKSPFNIHGKANKKSSKTKKYFVRQYNKKLRKLKIKEEDD